MQKPSSINRTLLGNIIWFAGSLVLAFFVRLLQPEMQGRQVEGCGTTRHAGALPVGGEQLVMAQGLAGLAGKAMQPVEQLL